MQQFIDKLISRLEEKAEIEREECKKIAESKLIEFVAKYNHGEYCYVNAINIVNQLAEEYKGGWISVKDRLPEYENKDASWVRCIVKVMRSHYPTSTYDDCDSPYDETLVMCAKYDVEQKIWHLDCDEQLNALIDVEDSPMNGDYVIEWMSLKSLY